MTSSRIYYAGWLLLLAGLVAGVGAAHAGTGGELKPTAGGQTAVRLRTFRVGKYAVNLPAIPGLSPVRMSGGLTIYLKRPSGSACTLKLISGAGFQPVLSLIREMSSPRRTDTDLVVRCWAGTYTILWGLSEMHQYAAVISPPSDDSVAPYMLLEMGSPEDATPEFVRIVRSVRYASNGGAGQIEPPAENASPETVQAGPFTVDLPPSAEPVSPRFTAGPPVPQSFYQIRGGGPSFELLFLPDAGGGWVLGPGDRLVADETNSNGLRLTLYECGAVGGPGCWMYLGKICGTTADSRRRCGQLALSAFGRADAREQVLAILRTARLTPGSGYVGGRADRAIPGAGLKAVGHPSDTPPRPLTPGGAFHGLLRLLKDLGRQIESGSR